MTSVITRYFDSPEAAIATRRELVERERFPLSIFRLFDKADGAEAALGAADVPSEAAKAYASRLASGGAVLMVRHGYKPLGGASIARRVMAEMGAVDMGDLLEEVIIKEDRPAGQSILSDHPHFLYRERDPSNTNHHMADWPIPLISRRKPYSGSLLSSPHARMANWPISLLSDRKPYRKMAFPPHKRMANFPIPLLSDRKPFTGSIIGRHARMANFPIPLISRRKPIRWSLFPIHSRMANWPFPHLINGKTSTNALIPGGPRMANFPIRLISKRKPFTGSIIGRHARMAAFPISLISKREPYRGMAIEPHGRMADAILPLVVKRRGESGFSFSKLLGWPTIIRR